MFNFWSTKEESITFWNSNNFPDIYKLISQPSITAYVYMSLSCGGESSYVYVAKLKEYKLVACNISSPLAPPYFWGLRGANLWEEQRAT